MTRPEKAAAIVPLVLSLLGWAGTFYLDLKKIEAASASETANFKIMMDLARTASARPCFVLSEPCDGVR